MTSGSKKIVGGFGWVALIRYSQDALGFLTTLVLAKLLVPEDFGVVAVAGMVIEMLKIFKDLGLSQALIYRQQDIERASHTAFLIVIGLNVFIFLCAVVVSPFAARFFNNPTVTPVIIVIASNLIWVAIRAVPDALLNKDLAFQKLVVPEMVPAVIGAVVSVAMAYKGFGVWSLVVRSVIGGIGGMLLIWHYTPYRPKLVFDRTVAGELLHYGKYIIGSSVVMVAVYNIDKVFISKLVGVAALGIYVLATKIANLPVSEFGHVVCRLMFPVFSKMNQELSVLRPSFLKTLRYTGLVTFPMAIGIATYGPDAIAVIYGDKWSGMILPLQILAAYALFRSLSVIIYEMFKATGNPKFMQQFVIVRLVLIGVLGIPALMLYGLIGMCSLVAATYGLVLVMEARKISTQLAIPLSEFLKALSLPLGVSLALIPLIYWVLRFNFGVASLMQVLGGIAVTVVCYASAVFLFDRVLASEVRQALFSAA